MSVRKRTWTGGKGETRTAWVVDYVDQSGRRRSKQFNRKKDADAWQVAVQNEINLGVHTPDRDSITLLTACDDWLRRAKAEHRQRSTIKSYSELCRIHIVPFLGQVKLSRLSRPAVERFRDQLLETRSKAMAKKALSALSSVIGEAQRRGFVSQNVARGVRVVRPSRENGKPQIPSRMELKRLIAAAAGRDRIMLGLAIVSGMRSSELRALQWNDVDFERKFIRVQRRVDDWGSMGPPKSAAGFRDIPISSQTVADLRGLRQNGTGSGNALVFPSATGTPLRHNNMLRRLFIPTQMAAGLFAPWTSKDGKHREGANGEWLLTGKYSFHSLRHAAASMWIDAGVDLKRLQAWLGHSSVQMTIDRYGHLIADKTKDDNFAELAARDLFRDSMQQGCDMAVSSPQKSAA